MDGLLIVDKPGGMTSHDVVARMRRILGERRVGHTGTLDPFATGVMVILVGRATRLAQFLNADEKEYEAVIRFGYETDTGDATGQKLQTRAQNANGSSVHTLGRSEIEEVLESFRGESEQVPPMYSAKKVGGERLYTMARRGIEVERSAVRVIIHQLEITSTIDTPLSFDVNGTCDLSVKIVCSAGTYIRTLAESIGRRLGMAAHLAALRRTGAGRFRIEDAVDLDHLNTMSEAGTIETKILAPDTALSTMPFVHLTADESRKARHGMALQVSAGVENNWQDKELVRMRDADERLIAVGFYDAAAGCLRPRVVLSP